MIKMITMKEYIRCENCEGIFDADELIMGAANELIELIGVLMYIGILVLEYLEKYPRRK